MSVYAGGQADRAGWSARLIPILGSVHMAGRVWTNVPTTAPWGRGPDGRTQTYVVAGWVAYGLFVLLVVVASRPIRNAHYSLFKVGHIVMVFGAITSLFIHRPERIGWLYGGSAIWALDRIWRLSRVLLHYCVRRHGVRAADRAALSRSRTAGQAARVGRGIERRHGPSVRAPRSVRS